MMFSMRPGFILFTANVGGNHATMFDPLGKRLIFSGDASVFDDRGKVYTWAFKYVGDIAEGDEFVFAVSEFSAVGQVVGPDIQVMTRIATVIRSFDGKPLGLVDARKSAHPLPARRPGALRATPNPKVSIITCTYNRPVMLAEAIESMRAQTDPSWEHIIVDNGSTTPAVRGVLDEAYSADDRIRTYRRAPNVDQPARFWNEGIDLARGKYIGFLDDDNLKDPRFVEILAGVLDVKPSVDMVTCGFLMYSEGQTSENQLNLFTEREINRRNTVDTGSFLIRREALERIGYFPLNIRTNEDWALIRKAAMCLRMEHVDECLATYRAHPEQRMQRCASLGNESDKIYVAGSGWSEEIGVAIHYPPFDRLTGSQQDVIDAASAGIRAIPWAKDGRERGDLGVVFAPFRLSLEEVAHLAGKYPTVVTVHSEDPYASFANGERVEVMAKHCGNLWVAANDTASAAGYREFVGDRVIVCPSLSVDHRAVPEALPREARPYDVLFVGYAYPARVAFMRELSKHFDTGRIKFRGNGWREAGCDHANPTASFHDTASMYGAARAVLCFHRQEGDCGGAPHAARLAQRGYVEGAGGARVFLDTTRPDHAFEDGEVEWFEDARDLGEKLTKYLASPDVEQAALAEPLRVRALRDFTYRTRMARVINTVRSLRYGAVIP